MVKGRIPFLTLAVISLLAGILAGLWRAGWQTPFPHTSLFNLHGPLMISGFLGTLISLERAIAHGTSWSFLIPVAAGLSGLLILADATAGFSPAFSVAAASGYNVLIILFYQKAPSVSMAIMGLGAVSWLIGNVLWLGHLPVPRIIPWWANFLVLTIAGERLELSRLLQPGRFRQLIFLAGILLAITGAVFSLYDVRLAGKLLGSGYVVLSLWLFIHDLARKQVRQKGLFRFMGLALISGYAWLGIGGLAYILVGETTAGFRYDAMLHAIFLGFVFSMIFAHGPIIFPAVLKVRIAFHWIFYVHLVLLHASLLVRVIGDMQLSHAMRINGSLMNAVAILLFFLNTMLSVQRTNTPER